MGERPNWVVEQEQRAIADFNAEKRPGLIERLIPELGPDLAGVYVDYIEGPHISSFRAKAEEAFVNMVADKMQGGFHPTRNAVKALLLAAKAIAGEAALDAAPWDSREQV